MTPRQPYTSLITCLIVLLGLHAHGADIHETRKWTFKNGLVVELALVNAYGSKFYFHQNNQVGSADLFNLSEEDQAEIVRWSRLRDEALLNGKLEPSNFTKRFREDAKQLVDGKLVDPDWSNTREPDFYAIYSSASWCGPCRRFTPELVRFYNFYKDFYKDRFEMILCSWDRSRGDMIDYMEEEKMPWYGNWRYRDASFWRKYQSSGIPCLVIVDRNGNTLSHSYSGDEYLGPRQPLDYLLKMLVHASPNLEERVSVPTPGIDMAKLSDAIRDRERAASSKGTDSPPQPVVTPLGILQKLEDPQAEAIILRVKVTIDARGIVRAAELQDDASPELRAAVQKSLYLWQFLPRITAKDGAVMSDVILPISLRLSEKHLRPTESLARAGE